MMLYGEKISSIASTNGLRLSISVSGVINITDTMNKRNTSTQDFKAAIP